MRKSIYFGLLLLVAACGTNKPTDNVDLGSSEDKGAEAASAAMNTWTVLRTIHGD